MDELNKKEEIENEKEVTNNTEETALEETEQDQPNEETEKAMPEETVDNSTPTGNDMVGKLICPRCGKAFEPKEKQCPYCGLKNNLKLCGTCGATMAKNAKQCPKCGAKNKKPFYKRVWFWILIVVVFFAILLSSSSDTEKGNTKDTGTTTSNSQNQEMEEKTTTNATATSDETAVVGKWTATYLIDLDDKKTIPLDLVDMSMEVNFNADNTGTMITSTNGTTQFKWSYTATSDDGDILYKAGDVKVGIIGHGNEMSEYEGDLILYTDSAAMLLEYSGAPSATKTSSSTSRTESSSSAMTSSQKNALKKAESYLKYSAFSYSGLIDQLEYEGFSTSDATYAVDHCGADWKEQAVKRAESYLKYSSFSKSGLIDQLEYEGFTHEQATYGADKAY